MVAALKFFLGQDEAADNESDDDDDDDFKAVQPSKAEVYKANSKVYNRLISEPIHQSISPSRNLQLLLLGLIYTLLCCLHSCSCGGA